MQLNVASYVMIILYIVELPSPTSFDIISHATRKEKQHMRYDELLKRAYEAAIESAKSFTYKGHVFSTKRVLNLV